MQRNETAAAALEAANATEACSAPAAPARVYFPVSAPQYCALKDGSAIRCSMEFR